MSKVLAVISAYRLPDDRNFLESFSRVGHKHALCLITVPRGDLAMQVSRDLKTLLPKELERVCSSTIGKSNMKRQNANVGRSLFVIGTPGRITDMKRRALIEMHIIPFLVIDEVDQLLDYTYLADMKEILGSVGKKVKGGRQSLLASKIITLKTVAILKGLQWCKRDSLMPHIGSLRMSMKTSFGNPTNNLSHLILKTSLRAGLEQIIRCSYLVQTIKCLLFITLAQNFKEPAWNLGESST